MKNFVPLIILLLAATLATGFYAKKIHRHEDDIDKLQRSLSGHSNILPPSARLSYEGIHTNSAVFPEVRYILAPAYISIHHQYDTVLTICDIASADSVSHSLGSRCMLWQAKDEQFYYSLTSKR